MLLFDLVFVIPNIQLAYFLQLSVMVDEHDVFQPFLVDILDKIQEVLVSAGTLTFWVLVILGTWN